MGDKEMEGKISLSPGIASVPHEVIARVGADYDIHPDGKILVLVRPAGGDTRGREITLVLN